MLASSCCDTVFRQAVPCHSGIHQVIGGLHEYQPEVFKQQGVKQRGIADPYLVVVVDYYFPVVLQEILVAPVLQGRKEPPNITVQVCLEFQNRLRTLPAFESVAGGISDMPFGDVHALSRLRHRALTSHGHEAAATL